MSPYRPRRHQPRQRTRTQTWWAERNHALTVPCVGAPRGCSVATDSGPDVPTPAGTTCHGPDGVELVNLPAHIARLDRARAENPQHLPLEVTTTEEHHP